MMPLRHIFLARPRSAVGLRPRGCRSRHRDFDPDAVPASVTATASQTPTITPSPAPSLTPTATWVAQGPGNVQVPILMYHHIAVSPIGSRYYVPPDRFESELKLLHDWGYTTISTTQLVQAITQGALLPPHPLILTFDDANEDNYTNAFPIMQKYGFTGVLYVPYDYIGTNGYLTVDNIQAMAAAGWEVGSHSLSHPMNFLALDPAALRSRSSRPARSSRPCWVCQS